MHHIAYINKMTETVARIAEDGLYLGLDYTGPHRNQYDWDVWSKIIHINQLLPPKYRQAIRYPHLSTMLSTDPTEAVHSELQLEVLQRHFDIIELKSLGGGIAYTLLFGNNALYAEQHTPGGEAALEFILKADADTLTINPSSNLFTFFIAKPKKKGTIDPVLLSKWQAEENEREIMASQNSGRYYPEAPLELIYNDLAVAEATLQGLR